MAFAFFLFIWNNAFLVFLVFRINYIKLDLNYLTFITQFMLNLTIEFVSIIYMI